MKKLSIVVLMLSIVFIVSGGVLAEVKQTNTTSDDIKAIMRTQADTNKLLNEIQNTQKAILQKLSEIEKKASAPVAQQVPGPDPNKVYSLPIAHSVPKGKKDAPVTITEFSDFQCPYCARLEPTLNEVLAAYPNEVNLVYKHYPLSFHNYALLAAKASEAAKEQGKFWEMHDLILDNLGQITQESLKKFAGQLGLNVDKFTADLASNKYDAIIQQDMALASTADVTGTPTLFVNGKKMRSRSVNDFKMAIDAALKK